MAQLQFSFGDFEREIGAIRDFAGEFIRFDSTHVIPQLLETLRNVRSMDGNRVFPWEIPEHSPLRTRTSQGQYDPDGKGGRNIFGEVSCTWGITPIRPKGRSHGQATTFALVGNASTRLSIHEELEDSPPIELAMWRMEIGDDSAPGVCFHVHVEGQRKVPPFPEDLSVPRLPTIMFTPMLAFDYLLGELFQDDWLMHIAGSNKTGPIQIWRGIQTKRLLNLLKWQLESLEGDDAIPWTWMKKLQPPHDLFTK